MFEEFWKACISIRSFPLVPLPGKALPDDAETQPWELPAEIPRPSPCSSASKPEDVDRTRQMEKSFQEMQGSEAKPEIGQPAT